MLIRYHLDEHLSAAIADGLRRRGVDVTTTAQAGLAQADDEEQLAYAHAAARVLVTRDKGFLRLHHRGLPHSGIAFWHSKRRGLGQLIQRLMTLWRTTAAADMVGRVQFL